MTSPVHPSPDVELHAARIEASRHTVARLRLGELLVRAEVLTADQVQHVLDGSQPGERFGLAVVRLGLANEDAVAAAVAAQLRLDRVDLDDQLPDPVAIARVPAHLAERHEVLPLAVEGDVLVLATADPADVTALDDIRMASGARSVRPMVATPSALAEARRRTYRDGDADGLVEELGDVAEEANGFDHGHELDVSAAEPAVRLVDAILADAVASRASDVHVEPDRDGLGVRVRVDGLLRARRRIPRSLALMVVSRLKILSRLDIAERRLPQDGRTRVRVDGKEIDLRVATMPTLYGEKVVVRLLPKDATRASIDEVGLSRDIRVRYLEALRRPQGLVLVTGPTGSGKTTTLYAGLESAADPTRNVLTLEDPIEYELPQVNQTQVAPKIGLTFARGLRHVLRQDPDVVLVGEIRDRETAELAAEASVTGHLVLATLHTNDAASAVARLVDLGADRFLVASSLLLMIGQRLAQRVCDGCAVPDQPDPDVLRRLGQSSEVLEGATPRRGEGCRACEHTGAHGRTAVGEALVASPRLRELILDGAPETAIARLARQEGMRTMREDALARARDGTITFAEALRSTPEPTSELARCPSCDTAVADDHIACPMCGTELAVGHCSGCGRAVEQDWTTCPWCRHVM